MVKTFTKVLCATVILAVSGISATAQDYISVNPTVTPRDGYVGGPQGIVSVAWPGVRLQMDSQDKDIKTPVDPSFVKITVNDNPVSINPNATGGGRIYVGAQETEGGGRLDDMLTILLPDMFFWWTGSVKVDILEGAVKSTSGAVNQAITLNYTFNNLNYDAIWEPAKPADGTDVTLIKGEAYLYVSWEGCTDLTITNSANPFYQKATLEDNGTQVPAKQYMSIDNGRVKFDLTSFDTGNYILDLTEGSIDLGDGSQNGETIYNFRIVETQVPECYVSPKPSSYDWFDSFSVVWADNITQPYALSSQYASLNENSGKLEFNAEGISQFKVSLNNIEDIEILAISIEEYQEDEDSKNYPNSQLLITLAGFQTEIDGRYSLTIPAGIINITTPDGTVVNDQEIFTFTLKAQEAFVLPAPTITPAEGTFGDLKEVVITWPAVLGGLDLLNKNQDSTSEVTATFNGLAFAGFETSFTWSSENAMTDGADGDQFVITFGDDLSAGTYSINIPEGFINVSDIEKGTYPSQLITLIYTIDGELSVETITDDGSVTIYDLNGVKVADKVDKSTVNNLPKGIYIVNGKKVVVK